MDGADVVRPRRQDPLEDAEQLGGRALGRAALISPVVPGGEVHQRIRRQHSDLYVLRETRMQGAHRIRIGTIERGAIRMRIRRMPA
jgi:hypothetical protein